MKSNGLMPRTLHKIAPTIRSDVARLMSFLLSSPEIIRNTRMPSAPNEENHANTWPKADTIEDVLIVTDLSLR